MQAVLATRSPHKAAEVGRILGPLGLAPLSLADLGVQHDPGEERLEVFETFRENALAKARWFAARLDRPVMADDSGLRVDALHGRPGVRTKRFSGRSDLTGSALDEANNAHLLDLLRDVPGAGRGARYVCCAAIAWPDGPGIAAVGTVRGIIAESMLGEEGFGYDPLFHVPGIGARFSQVPPHVKDALSHRARAFRALAAGLARAPWPLL